MAKTWTYKYGSNTIEVKNGVAGEELYVNGQLQDKKTGIKFSSDLKGKLDSGEEIKASLGGAITVKCNLFVNNELQAPVSEKD